MTVKGFETQSGVSPESVRQQSNMPVAMTAKRQFQEFLTDISYLSHIEPSSYPDEIPDSTGNDLSRRDSCLPVCMASRCRVHVGELFQSLCRCPRSCRLVPPKFCASFRDQRCRSDAAIKVAFCSCRIIETPCTPLRAPQAYESFPDKDLRRSA